MQSALNELNERATVLDESAGVGLWQAVLVNADAMHPQSRWTWSAEFRRLLGFSSEPEFPDLVGSWADRLHPDDVTPTFKAFGDHLSDRTGRARYDVAYRLKTRDGSYRWFRATGGCRHSTDGKTIRACGSLTDIHDQRMVEAQATEDAAANQTAIAALLAGLRSLAQGDLTHRITASLGPKTDALRTDFNLSMERLQETMQAIGSNVRAMQSGSQEIAVASDDLSRRTEQQAASLEETAAALDQITATVKKTAEGAQHARKVVSTANGDAEISGKVVRQAIEAMGSIEKSSNQISQIIGVIDEIAFQTNLLALNAGVEAARAGDAGRGFAVVASEVRSLAQRSAEAAKEIKGLISASSTHVSQGVELVAETGKSLNRIVQHVGEIDLAVGEIASSAQEQATALQEVNTVVNSMDQVTQQNASMVEQSTTAGHALLQEATQLVGLVGRFTTGAAEPQERRPATRSAPSRGVPALKTVSTRGGSSAVRRQAPVQAEVSWEEF